MKSAYCLVSILVLFSLVACSDEKLPTDTEKPTESITPTEIQVAKPEIEKFQLAEKYLFKKIPESLDNLEITIEGIALTKELDLDDLETMRKMGVKVAFDDEQNSYPIPDDISLTRLKQATIIDFNDQPLHEIPAWLVHFTNLKKLDLSGAYAPFKDLVNIPNAPNLEILDLSNNRLFNKDIKSLDDLYVWLNFLKKIQNVRVLDLSNFQNNYSDKDHRYVLANLNYLPNLMELNLKGNNLRGSLSELGLFELTELKKLNLSHNNINDGDVMKYLPRESLVELDLSNNQLEYFNFHGSVPSLELLKLEGNTYRLRMSSEYEGVFHTKNLVQLTYDSSATIPQGLIGRLEKLDNESDNVELKGDTYVDNDRGLMWDRCDSHYVGFSGKRCGDGGVDYWGYEVDDLIERLNSEKYLGYDDWRLPSIEELHSIIYCSQGFKSDIEIPTKTGKQKRVKHICSGNDYQKPAVNLENFSLHDGSILFANNYWSSTPYIDDGSDDKVWVAYLHNGSLNGLYKEKQARVLLVRSLN